jgi:hypothetical protein
MKKDYTNSRFKKQIRIDPEQYEYIEAIKGRYTRAGKLDEIINYYKKRAGKKVLKNLAKARVRDENNTNQ